MTKRTHIEPSSDATKVLTVGDLRRLIDGVPDETDVEFVEYRDNGGDDPAHELDLVAALTDDSLRFAPAVEATALDALGGW